MIAAGVWVRPDDATFVEHVLGDGSVTCTVMWKHERAVYAISLLSVGEDGRTLEALLGVQLEVFVLGKAPPTRDRVARLVTGGTGTAVVQPTLVFGPDVAVELRARVTVPSRTERVRVIWHGSVAVPIGQKEAGDVQAK